MPGDDRRTTSSTRGPRRAATAAAILLIGALPGLPWATPLEAAETKEGIVFKAAPLRVAAGGQGELRVTLTIPPGRSILAEPAPNNFTTSVTLILPAAEGLAPLQPDYPDGRKFDEVDGFSYFAHEGQVVITVPVKAAPDAVPGPHVLKGRLRYQPIYAGGFGRTSVLQVEVTIEVTAAKKGEGTEKEKPAATPNPEVPATRR